MPQQTPTPETRITPRRSMRLKKPETIRAKPSLLNQQTSLEPGTSNQQFRLNKPTSKLRELSPEIRILIFSYLITTERPFMIGRCQEGARKIKDSPRDIFTFTPNSPFKVQRDDSRNRPVQPPITRVCRDFREEALPLWYGENRFWLIHNEFYREGEAQSSSRGFDTWISQTPRDMFNFMQHVSICYYSSWPSRMMISIDLKYRRIDHVRRYSTYGDELRIYPEDFDSTLEQLLNSKSDVDGWAALMAILEEVDGLLPISPMYISAPPGMMRRQPASGWEYDW